MSVLFTALGFFTFLQPALVHGAEQTVRLSLEETVRKALQGSSRLEAARSEFEAATNRTAGQRSYFLPKLSFEAGTRYVTEVPQLSLSPGLTLPFGDNDSYSVGVALNWTLWDSGATYFSWRSSRAAEDQKSHEVKNAEQQLIFSVRLAYFKVMLASAQMSSVQESLLIAMAQYQDIRTKQQAGAASKEVFLTAGREVLSFESRFLQAQSELAQALAELFAFTGENEIYELTFPVNSRNPVVAGKEASLVVEVEPLEKTFAAFDVKTLLAGRPSPEHPLIAAYTSQAESLEKASSSILAGHWPKIQVFAKSSFDYPNGPNLEQIFQNSVGATLTWPIFEGGRVFYGAREKGALARAAEHRKDQAWSDLIRDWKKTRDQIEILQAQQKIHRESVDESEKIAKMVYSSYQVGRSNFLEVQTANMRLLEARIQAAKTDVQTLAQFATLANFVEEKSP